MAKYSVLKETRGLNTVADPVKIGGNVPYLSEAYNVDIDDDGRISRCKGFAYTARTEESHSIFTDGSTCLFVSGTVLYRLNSDYSRTSVRTGMTFGLTVHYAEIDGYIYYSNGIESGLYHTGADHAWVAGSYVGVDTNRVFISPPAMTCLEIWNGRLYGAQGKLLLYTEEYAYSWWDKAANWIPFDSDIVMVKGVKAGLFVGTKKGTWFLAGSSPKDFNPTRVDADPVLTHSAVKVDGSEFGEAGDVIFWCNKYGIIKASLDGSINHISEERLTFPSLDVAHGVYANGRYVVCIDREKTDFLSVRMNPKYSFNDRTGRMGALSQQVGFNFTSSVYWNDTWLAAGLPGICKVDSGNYYGTKAINAWFKTQTTDFGSHQKKRTRSLFVAGEGVDEMYMVAYSGDVYTAERNFSFQNNEQTGVTVPVGGNLKSRYWAYKIGNVQGSDFSIDEIEALVTVTV